MFEYKKENKYFAQVTGSLEDLAKKELLELGAEKVITSNRGCHFTADEKTLYRIIQMARIPQRILAPLMKFKCMSVNYLSIVCYKDIHWSQLFKLTDKFGIVCNVKDSNIKNSLYASQIMKDSICDQFRDMKGERPDFSIKEANIIFNLHINENNATISIDLCGESMHKRGYRVDTVRAPLQETVAAALLKETEWDGENKLIDFMCGSGTFLAEGLMSYCKLPVDFLRKDNHARNLPTYNKEIWKEVKTEVMGNIRKLPENLIYGNDVSPTSVVASLENLKNLPNGDNVNLDNRNFKNIKFIKDATIIVNPPYGVRLKDMKSTLQLYSDLGDFLKQKCSGCNAFVLAGSRELLKEIRLKPSWTKTIKNGNLETVFAKYELY
ncbi:MAG: hypothetical protein B6226_01095 [Candidatus Cloacimonetes bacterium 4572_65]|nr:MAG: hypothetical protein B6226_01095 [Candidatus Cloacimonetes bacterium 4572_65]